MTEETLTDVLRAVFMSITQAMGPKVMVNASVLLAGLAHDKAVDEKAREVLKKVLAGVDRGNA
jgi:hypothetical protein